MVKSAYSSGKPSYGVGAGNVPVIVDNDVDLADAATKIVNGASFDNGIICSHEQFVLVPEGKYRDALKCFEDTGKVWFTEEEKLGPVVAILPYKTFKEAVEKAKANLLVEGAGHSAAVHSNDESHIREAGLGLPVSRLVVNQPSSFTAGGSLTNGFAPTTTLGCGSWGGNSISENLDYKHLMNVSRIGKVISGKKVPTDAEIWA